MITPGISSLVWYWSDGKAQTEPMAAIVTSVWHDRLVSLTVFAPDNPPFLKPSVVFVQDGDARPEREFCELPRIQIEDVPIVVVGTEKQLARTSGTACTSTPHPGATRPASELERVCTEGPGEPDKPIAVDHHPV